MGWDQAAKAATFEVLSTSGDNQLGGTDMDNALIDYITTEFKKESGVDLRNDKMSFQRLREAAEKAKVELSSTVATEVNLPYITADATGPKHLTMKIERAKLESLIAPLVDRCRGPVRQAIKDASTKLGEEVKIDRVVLVGGPTRMPIVQQFLEKEVGQKIEGGIDPMECVALGAAVQGAIITGDAKDVLFLDVSPLSLGIETMGSVFTKLIDRNTTIPIKKSQVFSTAEENQTAVTIRVLQGERQMANDNTELGRFDLVGIPSAPRGVPQIEVTFDIDANGIVHVTAKDKATGKEQKIRIQASGGLSESDINKMVKDAEAHAAEDKKRREAVDSKNHGESLVLSTEKALAEHGSKGADTERRAIEDAVSDLKEALKGDDAEAIKAKTNTLAQASMKLGEAMYKQQAESEAGKDAAKDDVVDAEFTEVDDDKNNKKSA